MTDCSCRRGLPHFVRPALLVPLLLALLLVGALSLFPSGPVHAQEVTVTPDTSISIEAQLPPGETDVPHGASLVYRVSRTGNTDGALDLVLQTSEPRRFLSISGSGASENRIDHQVRFQPGEAEVSVRAPVLGGRFFLLAEYIQAIIDPLHTDDYISNQLDPVNTDIRRSEKEDVIVTISAAQDSIAEGDNAVFTLTRTGDTASTLTATVRVVDPDQVMRGNHWDPALPAEDFTKSVTFAAGAETATVSFPTRHNLRDTDDLTLTAEVRQDEGYNYWVGATFTADVTVTDDDTAAEFSLSVSPSAIDEGEDVTFTLTRHGDTSEALEETPFVLRIGADHRRLIWPQWEEPQDYGAAMDAGQSARDYHFTVHRNGPDRDFRYEAEFKPADGIPEANLAEYLSVRGERKVGASVRDMSLQQVWIASIGDDTFGPNDDGEEISHENYTEGQEVPFVIARSGSAEQIAEELVVQFRYFEIDHPYHRGSYVRPGTYYNPSDQRMFMTFPAGETRVGGSFVIYVDDVAEPLSSTYSSTNYFIVYFPRVPYVDYWSRSKIPGDGLGGEFRDNPRAISIALAEDDSDTIEEGETAEFVLTRRGSTDQSLTLDVAIDDPGDFRRGNHWMHTPDRTVAVTFDAGASTAALSVPTSDDWRDIPDNTITATIPPSQDGSYRPAYETEGGTSASVTVEDNDVAPKITLTASATTVVEGTAASFTMTRNDTGNRLHIPYEFGVQGEEQFQTYLWAETESQITLDVYSEDDDYDDPDEIVYAFSMVPLFHVPQDELNQYWTIEGPSSATITVTDNDLPLVGVDEVELSYRENGHGHVRFVREGQTGDELEVNFIITQDGNSLYLTEQIGHELTIYIPAGEESSLTTHLLAWHDGDEDDTTLTVTAVANTERYRIDPERASATFTVIDRDPLPVLSIADATASEGDGTIDFQVSIDSTVSPPSRREIGVIHYTQSGSAEPGEDYTGTSKFLTIPPLATSFTISIPLLDDALVEEDESFTLKLNFPINVRLQDGQGTLSATGTITDNEPTVSVSAVSDEVDEGDTAVLEFGRTGSTAKALTVYFSHIYELSPGGARVVHTTQSLEIPAGQASAQLSIETEDDGLDTVDRVFGISVVPPTWEGLTAYYRQDPATAWVTIKDTDLPSVSVEADSEGVHESYDADFTLTRVGRTDIALTVNVTVTQEGSFLPSGDPPSTVNFPAGSSTTTLTIATVGDSTLEDHGSVTVAVAEGDDYEVGLPASATTTVADNDRGGVSVSIAGENAAVDEGEDVVFTVTRTGGKELEVFTVRVIVREVNFGIDLRNSKNTKGKQYDVQFAAGSATATLTIATRDESYNDGNSYLWADLPLSANYAVNPFPGRAQVWVRDDDIPTVHVTPEVLTVVEDGINIPRRTFHRTGDTSQTLWLDVDVYSLQRRASGDERSPREGLQTVRSSINGPSSSSLFGLSRHAPIDGTESYVLLPPYYCETVPGDCGTRPQYRVGSPSSSLITMLNSAQGVRIEADRETVTEGEAATFTLTRHGSTSNARGYILGVRVGVTQNGQFIDGVPPQTVTFRGHPVIDHSISSLTATLTIPTIDDDVHEAGGSIEVVILPSTGIPLVGTFIYEPSSPASASVTVADNDPPTVAVSDASASEDAGTMQFTVSVPAAYERLTVDWETSDGSGDDAATAGSDYEAASGQVVFNDGEAERTISVNITDDNDEEGNETFTLTLKNPVGLVLPADPTATGTILDDDGSAGGPMIGELPSGVDVTITAAESSVEEGAAAAFTITRQLGSGAQSGSSSDDPLNVSLALSQEGDFFSPAAKNFSGATVTYDIAAATVDVTIPAGQLSVTLNLATDDDEVAEADGSITLRVAEGTGYEVGFPAIATTNVTDNDVGISISGVTQSEGEDKMTFTVSLSRSAGEAVTVVASTMDGTATSNAAVTATSLGKDFEAKTETLTISAGDTDANFTVTLLDDTIDEDAEEFTVVLSSPSDNAVLLDESATGAIEDNDDPMMVGVHRVGRTVNENADGPVVFRFQTAPQADSATTATERAITVRWTVLPGTATAGEDYVAVADPEETEIPVGLTTRSVEVTLTDDSLFEAIEETFTFEIKGAVNAVKNADHESIEMSIRDDEGMRADVLPVSPVVAEGEDAVFIVFLSESVSADPVHIIYSVVGTAGPSDYVAPSGTLIIPVGATSGAITIATVADEIADGDETLGVLLTRATMKAREVITPEEQGFVTVLDANTLSASFVPGASAEEGKAVEFTVRLSTVSDRTVRVTWKTEDAKGMGTPATAGTDYTDSTGTVEFSAGETSAAFTVGTTQDSLYEGNEVFGARLIDAVRVDDAYTEVAVPLGTSSMAGAILDDDAQPTAITLTATPATVNEGAGETEFTVTGTLTGSTRLTGDVEIALNLEGSVSEDEDVDDTDPPTLTISAGQASGTTTIAATPLDDEVDDDGASIRITGTSDGFDVTEAIVTVTDDDDAPTGVTLSLSQNTIGEGDDETELTVTATLTGGGLRTEDTQVVLSVEGVSIPSTVEGEDPSVAAGSNDFTAQDVTLTIPARERSGTATVTITPVDDNLTEGSETAQISGENDDLDVTPARLTIEDNDQDATGIRLSVSPASITEKDGAEEIEVTATLTGGGVRMTATTVVLTVADVSAITGIDYTAATTNLVIPGGQLSGVANVSINLIDDDLDEPIKRVAIRGTNDDPGLPVRGARVSILDDDLPPTGIVLSVNRSTVQENLGGQAVQVTAEIQGNRRSTKTVVTLATAGGTAIHSTDYRPSQGLLTIPAGARTGSAPFLVEPIDDQLDEDDETLNIGGSPSLRSLNVQSAVITITDDDTAGVAITPNALTIDEGSSGSYRLALQTQPSETVTVTVTGQAGTDLTLDKTTLTFTDSNWGTPQALTVTAGDDADGANDSVTLTHTAAGGEYEDLAADLSVTVVDDDETASVVLTPTTLSVDEGDETGVSYTVELATQPTEDVTVTVTGQAGTDLTLTGLSGTNTLTFTTDNWNTAQTVTVTAGHDDDGADDSVTLTHTAAGGNYEDATADLSVTVVDDDRAIVLTPTSLSVGEGDATGATYTVKLATQPSAEVTVTVTGQASTDLTLTGLSATNTLTFTASSWDTAQTVTVTAGDDDDGANDTVTLTHTAAGGEYASVTATLTVTVVDDDRAIVLSPTSLSVNEGDDTGANYTVKLATEPTEDITVTVTGQANTDLNLTGLSGISTLTFTTDNWDTAQTVTVTAGQDADGADDSVTLTHTATGGNYAGATATLAVTVDDDETVSVVLSESSLTVDEEDATGETYTVKLSHVPLEQVTVTVSGQANTDLTLTGLSGTSAFTFTADNWDTAQQVTVTASEDADGADDAVTLTHTAAGGEYASVTATLPVTVIDNDRAIVLSKTALSVDEGSAAGSTYTVKLATQPSETVTVAVSGHTDTDVSLDKASLTFTTGNWNTAQAVKVTATEDADGADDSVTLTHTATGGNYAGETAGLAVTVDDDETVSVVLSKTALSVDEGDTTGSDYTVKLSHQPSEQVTVTVAGQAGTDLTLTGLSGTSTLTFTTDNWNTAQTVTVKAGHDDDGTNDSVTLTHTAAGGEYASVTATLPVTVVDDDRAIVLTPATLSVGEGDATGATYTVKLATQPSEEVTVAVTGQTDTDVSVDKASLTFTTVNWNSAQTVTVTAAEDADGSDDTVTLTHTATGGNYAGETATLGVTVDDDETVSVVLSEAALSVDEGGAAGATYTVKLSHLPSEQVTVTVTGHAGTDLTLNKTTLTLTTSNWNTAQTVTVTAAHDDDGADDAVTLTHTATGGEYAGATADLPVTVVDDDRGIVLTPTTLSVAEGDATGATYTVKLATQPSEEVTVAVTGHTGTDVSLDTASLTFTTDDWSTAQTVKMTAAEDADGADYTVTLTHTAAGGNYAGETATLEVTVVDDETVSVVLSEAALSVDEGGAAGSDYTVRLSHQPSEQVTVMVTGHAGTDLTLNKTTLTFTTSNWNTAQTVTVTAAHDDDGADDAVTLTHTATGGEYASVTADLSVTVNDDDRAIVLSPVSLSVDEGGATGATYTVKLATQPSEEVTVAVTGQTDTDVSVDKASLTFTTVNWNSAQTVTVTAAEDADGSDDTVTLTHTATGGNYAGETATLGVTVDDDETVSVVLSKTTLSVDEGGAAGSDYTVRLSHQPSEDVTVTVTGQAGTDLTLTGLNATNALTFTTDNWNTAQTVTVTAGHDDDGDDDSETLTHTATGGEYASVTATLPVTVIDDDKTLIIVPTALTVQAGGSNSYTVVLGSQPAGDVTVSVSGHSGTDLTLDKTALTFTTSNWNTAQTVSVTGDADAAKATVTLSHAVSSDADSGYDAITASDVEVSLLAPGDRAQIQVGVDTSTRNLTVDEGDSNTYSVVLSHQPSGAVSIVVNDPTDNTDVTTSPASLTFTTSNWNTVQTVTVSAAHDTDGTDDTATVTHSVSGGGYDGITSPDVSVTVVDDDRAIVLSRTSLSVDEGGATGATYTVKLATQPSETVTVAVTGHTGTDVSVNKASLTFTTDDWSTAQTVTVTVAEDADGSDDTVTLTHTATGGNYAGETAKLSVTVDDDETVSVVLSEAALSVDEGGAAGATYTVKLSHLPSEQVTVTVTGHAGTDLTLNKTTLTLTTSNWNTAQTVTVTAAHDDDGADDAVTLTHTATGGEYAGATADLPVTVVDDDRGIVLTPTTLSVAEGDATGATYTVKLATQPSEEVTVAVTGHTGTDVSLDTASLTFTTDDWSTAQTVKMTAAEDADGADYTVTLTHTAAGGNYAGETATLEVTVVDDETVSVVLSEAALSVDEGGAAGSDYTVRLSHQPSEQVTVMVTGHAGTDLTLNKTTLTFTTSNWNTAQTVTVTAAHDDDGADDAVTLTHTATGGEYASVTADLSVTVNDDDRAIVLSPVSLSVDEGGATGATYTVKLATQPSEEVTVAVTGQTDTDVSVDKASLTFTTVNWNSAQTVTVTAAEDADGSDDTVTLTHTATGGNYAGETATLGVTVDDDETVSVVLSKTTLSVDEGGAAGSDYTVRLSHQPSEDVTVTVTGLAGTDLTLTGLSTPDALTFTTDNWNTARTVTVTAAHDDDGADDAVTLTHTAGGGEYEDVAADLAVTVVDDDRAIVLTPTTLSVAEGDATGETYTVKLATQPSETVTVTVTGHTGTDVSLDTASLTFTTDDWDTAQTVKVTAAEDADGADDSETLTHTASGGNFEGVTADLAVTVDDDETVSVVLSKTTLSVDEGGAAGSDYTVRLSHQPSEDVTVTVTGLAGTDLTLTGLSTPDALTFTTDNWDTAQTVTVTAGQDADGANDAVTLTHTAAGGEYTSVAATLPVTVVDDDRTIVLSKTALSVNEGSAAGATYTVKLATQPSAQVTVAVTGHSGTDVSVDTASLTFTTDDWDTAQTVTVTAAEDDDGADDSVTLTHTASGGNYAGETATLAVTVDDDETVSVVLSETALSVDEGDDTGATYTVKLATQPSETVTVTVTGQAGTDLTLTGLSGTSTLTFTTDNWDTAQTVTVTAGQDADGADDAVTLTHTATGGEYEDVTATLPVTVVDDDRAIVLSRTSLSVDEGSAAGSTYTVKLATQPSEEVTVTVTGHSGTDVSVDTASLTFTTGNWNTAQTVKVTAAEDADGADDSVTLTHTAAGGNYAGETATLAVTVDDDETVSVVLSETALSVDEEDDTGATYTVKLATQPSETVTVAVSGHTGTDVSLDKATLTFTTGNWNTAQSVTVTAGQDDDGADDSVTLTHTAAGGEYASVTATLPVTVIDDDRAIVLSPASLSVDEGSATGSTYTVKLATQPSAQVTVAVTGHSGTDVSLDKATMTFTTGNWSTAQTVTVTAAEDDDGADDSETLTHTAAGGNYAGETATLAVTVDDDETVSVVLSETALSVDEGDDTGATYTVKLATQPSETVTVTVTGQAGTDLTLTGLSGTSTLTFTTDNWNTAQTVTVTAGHDADGADDSVTLTHTAAGGEYASVAATLPVTVVDDDRAIVLSRTSLSVDEGSAAGSTYTVKLATQPSAQVTVAVTGHSGTDVSVDTASLTFTTDDWSTAQTVKVTAAEDDDGADDSVTLTHTATGGNYAGETATLEVTVVDDETVSVVLSEAALSVDEGGAAGSDYTVRLSHQPSEQVTVMVTGHAGTDLTLNKTTLTFTTSNWNTAQTVTVTAAHDDDGADDAVTLTHTATGGEYASVTADLSVTVNDDDRAIVLSPVSLSVDEGGATGATYTVKLATQPSEEVTVAVTGQTDTDVSVDKASLTFTTVNWNSAQTVTVTAAEDDDGADDAVTLTHTATGGNYAGETATLGVTVDDDETVSVVLSKTTLSVDEGGAAGSDYTVRLSHQPSEDVTVTVTGLAGTDLTLTGLSTPDALTFTTDNWDTAQTVTVTAGQDADGADDSVILTHTAAGGEYASVAASLPVTVVDDDRAIVLSRTSLSVDEGSAAGSTYTVKLATQPSAQVTVAVTGHSGTDVSLDKATMTFTTGNWSTAQTVKVTAAEDADGSDDTVTLRHTASGGNFEGVTADLAVTVDDDETVSVVLSESSLSVGEGDDTGATYTVKLATQPSETVTVTVTGQAGTDLTLTGLNATNALTFTTDNWNTAQTVTVTAGQDADGADDAVTLTHTATGGEYEDVTATLPVTVVDDDRAIVLSRTSLSVDEGSAAGSTYTVKLATQPSAQVTVAVTGHSGTDVSVDTASLTFTTGNWNTAQTVTVTAAEDDDGADDSETLTHTAAGGNYAGETATLAVTVDDDDKSLQISATVSFANTIVSVSEGATTTVSVQLSQSLSEVITVGLTTTNQSSATNADYSGVPASLEFAIGDTTKSFTFVAVTDLVDELDEEVVIGFGTLPEGLGAGADNQATITIRDATSISISFDSGTYSATEGGSDATVTVELSATPAQQVEITLTATGHDGATSDDWSGVPSSLTFDPGDTSKSFTVTAIDDTVEDDGEMVELGFGALPEGFVDGAHATARVTLMNDDQQVTCDDADQYTEDDVEVSVANNGKSLPDQAANTKGYVPVLEVGQTLEGYIAPCFDWDMFGFELEEGKYYRLDYLGASSLDGTLRDPNILALFNDGPLSSLYRTEAEPVWYRYSDGKRPFSVMGSNHRSEGTVWVDPGAERQDNWRPMTEGNTRGGLGTNARQYLMHFPAGMYYALLIGDGHKIGTYRIRLTEVSDDDSGIRSITLGNSAMGSLDFVDDEDTFEVTLKAGTTYDINIDPIGSGWEHDSAPFVNKVEDVAASTVHDYPFTTNRLMRSFTLTPATTGIHRFTVIGHTIPSGPDFADGEYRLTVSEHIFLPSAPQNLTVSSLTHDSVTLTWEAPEDSVVESYQILRRSLDDQEYGDGYGSTKFVVVADEIGSGETSYTDTSVEPRTRYVYRMKAGNERGLSERSNYANADTPAENSAATGAPTISGTVQVGETLTVDTSGIDDADGLNDVSYSYQWLAGDMEIADATDANYMLDASDLGQSIKVRVDFTDDAGNQESLTSQPVGPVDHETSEQRVNSPPTGAPTISGTVQVEETLTADTSSIGDSDGLNDVSYSYQWLADDTDILGATDSSYTLTDAEEGKTIKVRVSFTDDQGSSESLTSAATAVVAPATSTNPLLSFTLVDASDQTILATLTVGAEIELDDPANGSYGIRVDLATDAEVGSVLLELSGAKTVSQTENIAPYSLYGDDGTNLNGENLPAGSYTLRATAYSGRGGGGDELQVLEVSFTVVVVPAASTSPLVTFTLVDTSNQSILATLANGGQIQLDDPANGSYGIRVELEANAEVGSVLLELSGAKTVSRTENISPYSLYGDDGTNLNGENLPAGSYTLRATAYSGRGGGGDELQVLEVSFTVAETNN